MKKVLVCGKNSYIGTSFINYVKENQLDMTIDEIDMVDGTWRDVDFSTYDTIFHVAGLAHATPDESMREMYYKVNTDLAIATAKKAKHDGVKQFVFMSSIIVYGSGNVGEDRIINWDTPMHPDNFYGDSKVQAEKGLELLKDNTFKVVILRPPMIYGPHSKGNYPRLAKFAKKSFIFPNFHNQRSMLYIKNLCSFISLTIKNEDNGVFLPQNDEYVCTSDLVKKIAQINDHAMMFTKVFNPFIKVLQKKVVINKVFGSLTIDKNCSVYVEPYCCTDFNQSLRESEEK